MGEAAITGAGNLAAKHVIHAASMHLGAAATEQGVRDSTRNSLQLAQTYALHSIAFPAIGTGIAGFPAPRCAEIMLAEVRKHLSGPTTLDRIEFVLFDQPTLRTFEQVFAAMTD